MKKWGLLAVLLVLIVLPTVSAFSYGYHSYRDGCSTRDVAFNLALIIVSLGMLALIVLSNVFFFTKTGTEKETWKVRLKLVNKFVWGFFVSLILMSALERMPLAEVWMRGVFSLIMAILMGLYVVYSIVAHYLFLATKNEPGCSFIELLDFKGFVIPSIIQVFYYSIVFNCVVAGLALIFLEKAEGILFIIAGPIIFRIVAELVLVPFKIEKNTRQ